MRHVYITYDPLPGGGVAQNSTPVIEMLLPLLSDAICHFQNTTVLHKHTKPYVKGVTRSNRLTTIYPYHSFMVSLQQIMTKDLCDCSISKRVGSGYPTTVYLQVEYLDI